MVVALQHEILPRLIEGLLRDFAANSDAHDYWGGRMYEGPFTDNDVSVVPPQIFVAPVGGADQLEPGVSGVQGNYLMRALIGIFEPIRRVARAAGSYTEHDRLGLLKRIITNGSDDNGMGRIIDPYNSGSSDTTQKYLNTTMPTFDDKGPLLIVQKGREIAVLWAFAATFQTKIDNLTLLRR